MVLNPSWAKEEGCLQNLNSDQSTVSQNGLKEEKQTSQTNCDRKGLHGNGDSAHQDQSLNDEPRTPVKSEASVSGDIDEKSHSPETAVWICCDVYDTGIGIPGMIKPHS